MASLPAASMEKGSEESIKAMILDAPSPMKAKVRPAETSTREKTVPDLSAPRPDYQSNPVKCLQLCYELQKAQSLVLKAKSSDELSSAAEILTRGVLKPGALTVVSRSVEHDHPFTFNSINGLEAPEETELFPLVVELVVKHGVGEQMFVRLRVNLDHYDGVTALHTSFQVLEYLEHGGDMEKISPFPFTGNNGAYPGTNFGNFARNIARVLRNSMSSKRVQSEGGRRVLRFHDIPASTKFRDLTATTEAVRKELQCDGLALTVNFSPQVAVAIVPDMATLQKSREEKLNWLALPPVGAGPPPPMGQMLAKSVSNTVFFNNYGKHEPNISAEVTDFIWDWVGLVDECPPFNVVVSIKGRLFARWCMPADDYKQIHNAGLLDCLGEGEDTTRAV